MENWQRTFVLPLSLSIPPFLWPPPPSNFSLLRQLYLEFLSWVSLLIVRGGTKDRLYLDQVFSASPHCPTPLSSSTRPEIASSVEISDWLWILFSKEGVG